MILTSSKFVAGPAGRCWNIGIMRDMVVILTPNSSKTLSRRSNVFLIKRVLQCSQFHQFTNRAKQRYRSIYLTSLRVSAWILFSVILTDGTLGEKK